MTRRSISGEISQSFTALITLFPTKVICHGIPIPTPKCLMLLFYKINRQDGFQVYVHFLMIDAVVVLRQSQQGSESKQYGGK